MNKSKSSSLSLTIKSCFYLVSLLIITLLLLYWFCSSNSSSKQVLADISYLPQSSLFTYFNISSQVQISETQGILYVPPHDQPAHFGSIKSKAVRGNHHHKDNENSISSEIIVLLQGQFQFRIGDSNTNKYEDYQFDITKMGIIALKFPADKCHALKNIGLKTNWFASYYIKSKEFTKPSVNRESCNKMLLT
jgi:hypothetical protein